MRRFSEEVPDDVFRSCRFKSISAFRHRLVARFITQFKGRKRVILFDNKYSEALYKLSFMVQRYIDPEQPDYNKYPGLKNVEGYETILEDGETLFMPSGIWYYMN